MMTPAEWVDTPDALVKAVKDFQSESILGIDTESNSLYVYKEQVCLIQISTPENDYLIDPLAIKDLSPLAPIFASREIEKVFHAAEYDVICLKRDFKFEINNIFDTMLAARILGHKNTGLGSILEEKYAIIADKKYQRANWGKRPVNNDMLKYAQMDSHFLIEIRAQFHQELTEHNRMAIAQEDFSRLSNIEPPNAASYEQDAWKIASGQSYQNKQISVLMALCKYRDKLAHDRNVPLFKIFPNHFIQTLVENMPVNREDFYSMGYSPIKRVEGYMQPILSIIIEAKQNKNNYHVQHNHRPEWDFFKRLDAMRAWRKQKAIELKVMSDIILPKDVLMEITHQNPDTLDQLASIMQEIPWRYENFGEQILTVIHE
ncbi:MAG: HRDC domain-containing protein [Anaerolineaceae bacterium]|nr:HRDC domain-containing protein [Anaerolineaceae bacterium]